MNGYNDDLRQRAAKEIAKLRAEIRTKDDADAPQAVAANACPKCHVPAGTQCLYNRNVGGGVHAARLALVRKQT